MVIVISIDRMTSSEIIANRSRYHSKAVGGEICATTPVHEQVGFNGLLVAVGHILIGMEGIVSLAIDVRNYLWKPMGHRLI